MKKFLKNIIKFFVIFYSSLFAILIVNNYLINKNANFKLDKKIHNIILGNSQPECAYNDSLISNFKNLAKSGEPYFYNYQKLKNIIKQNPQLHSVFVEFNPSNILIREDQKIWRDWYINHHLPIYNTFLNINDHKLLAIKNSVGYQHAILKSLNKNINRIFFNRYEFIDDIGGYKYLIRNKVTDSIIPNNNKQHQIENTKLSTYDLLYLDKIILICQENNINIYLIRSPYHKKYIGNAYEAIFQQVKSDRYRDIPFIDFKDFQLQNDEFGDLEHLNYKGAKKFSLWFNNWLQNQA